MVTAEELLDNAYASSSATLLSGTTEEGHIVIGEDRRITVPTELKRLAVQYDHDIETVTFDCPRYWDEHDMSMMSIYVNYLRSDEEIGTFRAENVVVDVTDSSIMHFDWTISRNVTEISGKLAFLVCVKNADSNGNEVNHWNSEICKDCYVSEGLEVDGEEYSELYADVIEQWHKEILGHIGDMQDVKNNLIELRDSGEFDGATFIPSVSEDGNISWTNDKDKTNPLTVNIRGPNGVSPTIVVSSIEGGHRITITDVNGTQSFDVLDTVVTGTDELEARLNQLFSVGTEEPASGPVLWFNTDVTI